jgi:hypothetical protein
MFKTIQIHRLLGDTVVFGLEFEDRCVLVEAGHTTEGCTVHTDFGMYGLEIVAPNQSAVFTCDINKGSGTYHLHLSEVEGVIQHAQ